MPGLAMGISVVFTNIIATKLTYANVIMDTTHMAKYAVSIF